MKFPAQTAWLVWLSALAFAGDTLHARLPKWSFVVFGDTISYSTGVGVNTDILAELGVAIAARHPDFLLFGGDFAIWADPVSLEAWTNTMAPLYEAGIPIFPAVGNHDLGDDGALAAVFGPNIPTNGPADELRRTYALRHYNALVLVLNEYAGTNDYRVNQGWVDAVLATNRLPHVFALGHLPAFKLYHQDGMGLFPTERDAFWNSLSNAHARIYFGGHDHFYDHARLDDGDGNPDNDLHQIIVGTGGALLYPDGAFNGTNGVWTPVRIFHEAQYGFLLVEINDDQVRTTWFHRVGPGDYGPGSDVFTYSLGPRPVLTASYEGGHMVLSWSGSGLLESGPDPAGVFTEVPSATSPYVVPGTNAAGRFFRLALPWR